MHADAGGGQSGGGGCGTAGEGCFGWGSRGREQDEDPGEGEAMERVAEASGGDVRVPVHDWSAGNDDSEPGLQVRDQVLTL